MKLHRPVNISSWAPQDVEYDLAIGTIGYEQRSSHAFSSLALRGRTSVAFGFTDQRELSYWDNYKWYESAGFKVSEPTTHEFAVTLQGILNDLPPKRNRVCVDISSMTRLRMAVAVDLFRKCARDCVVDFIYSIAKYSPPVDQIYPYTHVGAVTPQFAGWWGNPQKPPIAVVGLGYEQDKALGAVEHIQAAEIWTFIPRSAMPEYTQSLESANATLLELVKSERKIRYQVEDPVACFKMLETLVYGLMQRGNPVLLPFGPKLFALCALLTATLHSQAAVWRISAQHNEPTTQRIAAGEIYGIRASFIQDFDKDQAVLTETAAGSIK
jgi:hypothetical protein